MYSVQLLEENVYLINADVYEFLILNKNNISYAWYNGNEKIYKIEKEKVNALIKFIEESNEDSKISKLFDKTFDEENAKETNEYKEELDKLKERYIL